MRRCRAARLEVVPSSARGPETAACSPSRAPGRRCCGVTCRNTTKNSNSACKYVQQCAVFHGGYAIVTTLTLQAFDLSTIGKEYCLAWHIALICHLTPVNLVYFIACFRKLVGKKLFKAIHYQYKIRQCQAIKRNATLPPYAVLRLPQAGMSRSTANKSSSPTRPKGVCPACCCCCCTMPASVCCSGSLVNKQFYSVLPKLAKTCHHWTAKQNYPRAVNGKQHLLSRPPLR